MHKDVAKNGTPLTKPNQYFMMHQSSTITTRKMSSSCRKLHMAEVVAKNVVSRVIR